MGIKGKKDKGLGDAKTQLMNKRMQKIKEKMERKKEQQSLQEKEKAELTPQRRGSVDSKSSIIHKNLFDSSATSEANAENSGRKHFYKDGKFRPKDLRGSKKSAPRLRTKTRSKVKNFKRDTRTNEQKAARGLQVFNE